ncbi:MAG TPA: DUF3883 domain-containing protein [Phycisphaerales bacterium]|nr:DUF3883 domain-containing protein [Phycisphaerales bacterium]
MAEVMKARDSRLIEIEAIIVAYAMSRLNDVFLARFRFKSWRSAFASASSSLGVPATSMKNLRDEFDPLHGFRKGWHQRPIRPNRQRVLSEFSEVSDDALLEVVDRLLARDQDATAEIVNPIAFSKDRVENVAERLRTGRLAEEYFVANSLNICRVPAKSLRDCRQDAGGFDFAVIDRPSVVIEVKGLKARWGGILFTDREWRTARARSENYWLVVVGDIAGTPKAKIWRDPSRMLDVRSSLRRSTTVSWQAAVSVA